MVFLGVIRAIAIVTQLHAATKYSAVFRKSVVAGQQRFSTWSTWNF